MPSITHIDSNTRMIKPNADPALTRYPVYYYDMRMDNTNWTFAPIVEIELVNSLGYFSVELVDQPPGDVVTEGLPELRDGDWWQVWNVRSFTPEELAFNLAEAKKQLLYNALISLTNAGKQGILLEFDDDSVGYVPMTPRHVADFALMSALAKDAGDSMDTYVIPLNDAPAQRLRKFPYLEAVGRIQQAYRIYLDNVANYYDAVAAATTMAELPTEFPANM